jgi:lysozyme
MSFNYMGVHLIDVSFYQDDPTTPQQIDFKKMRAAGASGVIIRAGQNAWEDPDFRYNYQAAKEAGLPRGVYFFYDSRVPPEAQAVLCLSLIAGDKPELGVWLDLEENYNGKYKGWINWKLCLNKLKAGASFVGIYTGPGYWTANKPPSNELSYFKTFPLWIANYDVLQPAIPAPWEYAILWQIGTPAVGLQYGCESLEVDMNYWNGSADLFRQYFGLGASQPPTEPTEPGAIMQGKVIKLTNIRADRTQFSADMGDLLAGDIVEWQEEYAGTDGLTWIKIISATRNGALVRCTDGNTATGRYCWSNNVEEIEPPAPPATFPPRIGYTVDGTTIKWYVPE